ncbi:hypothetical protein [Amycolatopsis sp. VC5-11]|uniref:hypothetical protein n=1 Tax=Amycolatopsis sp. VC5-11 TaxID=3120156 RepID=UPI00300B3395
MSEAEYLPVVPHFNPAHPDHEGWAAGATPQPVAKAPASEEPPVPDPDENPKPSRKQSS